MWKNLLKKCQECHYKSRVCVSHKNKIIENVRENGKFYEILAVVRYDYLNEETYFMEVMS